MKRSDQDGDRTEDRGQDVQTDLRSGVRDGVIGKNGEEESERQGEDHSDR